MANMKTLAKDTAIYGMSSIVGRFLNYLLVPIYTRVLDPSEYGVVTNLYGYTALILVILTFGMETTFFRFANKEEEKSDTVFTTSFAFVTALTILFIGAVSLFITPIGHAIGYEQHHDYILMMAAVVSIDVIQAIPFCYLRFKKRPIKFACLKLLFIAFNMGLNIFYFLVLGIHNVAYVFILNLVCSGLITFLFIPEFVKMKWKFDGALLKRMLSYTWPLFILGIAGILNQTADKIIFPLVYPDPVKGKALLGIYGGCVKIAMIMAMITQAFRYAYEPIVFAQAKSKDKNETYALGMKYFIIFTLLAFLAVIAYLPILQHIVGKEYLAGMRVVPIVMAAEIMMGVYFNLSFWYKLIDKTIYGAWFSLAGCTVLFAINLIFIPEYNYMACAWGGFAGYGTAMVLSYVVGQRKNPIQYPMKDIAVYVVITILFYFIMTCLPTDWNVALRLTINTLLLLLFVAHIVYHDLPLKSLPIVGKYFVIALGMLCMFTSCEEETTKDLGRSYEPYKIIDGYADSITYKLQDGITGQDWMSKLTDNRKICKLSIPGTHDSATGLGFYNKTLEYIFNMTAISQLTNIGQQLDNGIRFFDIRPVVDIDTLTHDETLFCAHGISVIDFKFEDALNEIAKFLTEHPSEFVIVKLQGDNGTENQRHWIPLMNDVIENYTYAGKSDFFAEWSPGMTVGEARGKIICINRTEFQEMTGAYCDWMDENADNDKFDTIRIEDEHNQVIYNVDYTDSTRLAAQDYYKTNNDKRMQLKKKAVQSMLEFATEEADDDTWVINHCSAYTDVSPVGYMKNAEAINPLVINYLTSHPGKTVGIVVMDFAGFDKVKCIINGGTPYTSYFIEGLKPMSASLTNLLIMSNF